METGGGPALDGVTATPGVSAIPTATAPMRGSALRSFMLSSAHNGQSHRHAVSSHNGSRGKKSWRFNSFPMSAGMRHPIVSDVLVLTYRYGAE
jgi:hypothetical protein